MMNVPTNIGKDIDERYTSKKPHDKRSVLFWEVIATVEKPFADSKFIRDRANWPTVDEEVLFAADIFFEQLDLMEPTGSSNG